MVDSGLKYPSTDAYRKTDFSPDHPTPGFVGSPGNLTARFDAIGIDQETLQLIYRRPFDPDTPPAQTFKVTVVVK